MSSKACSSKVGSKVDYSSVEHLQRMINNGELPTVQGFKLFTHSAEVRLAVSAGYIHENYEKDFIKIQRVLALGRISLVKSPVVLKEDSIDNNAQSSTTLFQKQPLCIPHIVGGFMAALTPSTKAFRMGEDLRSFSSGGTVCLTGTLGLVLCQDISKNNDGTAQQLKLVVCKHSAPRYAFCSHSLFEHVPFQDDCMQSWAVDDIEALIINPPLNRVNNLNIVDGLYLQWNSGSVVNSRYLFGQITECYFYDAYQACQRFGNGKPIYLCGSKHHSIGFLDDNPISYMGAIVLTARFGNQYGPGAVVLDNGGAFSGDSSGCVFSQTDNGSFVAFGIVSAFPHVSWNQLIGGGNSIAHVIIEPLSKLPAANSRYALPYPVAPPADNSFFSGVV